MPQTITYRGPRVLVGALAHLLREEGVEFDQPRENRTEVVEVAVVVLVVRAGDGVLDRTLDAMIDAAVARFKKRFGDDVASVEIADSENHRQAFVLAPSRGGRTSRHRRRRPPAPWARTGRCGRDGSGRPAASGRSPRPAGLGRLGCSLAAQRRRPVRGSDPRHGAHRALAGVGSRGRRTTAPTRACSGARQGRWRPPFSGNADRLSVIVGIRRSGRRARAFGRVESTRSGLCF